MYLGFLKTINPCPSDLVNVPDAFSDVHHSVFLMFLGALCYSVELLCLWLGFEQSSTLIHWLFYMLFKTFLCVNVISYMMLLLYWYIMVAIYSSVTSSLTEYFIRYEVMKVDYVLYIFSFIVL